MKLHDYLIAHDQADWSAALSGWSWLLPSESTLWLVNRFCDLFLVTDDGAVHMLDVGGGTLTKLAESRDDFRTKIDEDDNANIWLMIPLVDELVASGKVLQPGQCYGFKVPPVMGGQYEIKNIAPISIPDYLGAYGSIHGQLQSVPDGTEVVLKIINQPE